MTHRQLVEVSDDSYKELKHSLDNECVEHNPALQRLWSVTDMATCNLSKEAIEFAIQEAVNTVLAYIRESKEPKCYQLIERDCDVNLKLFN